MSTQADSHPSPVRTGAARAALLTEARETGVDVFIVGGGITGAGTARDAALRGLRVMVIDAGDWAQGTSSRSSKLIHGGLRYLENMQFGLVMEGTRERYRQAKLNAHLVEPLAFVMPIYKGGRHSLFKINLGLWLYDILSLFRAHKLHKRLNAKNTIARTGPLRADGLVGSVHYFDCRGDDARLTLANILDAERHGAFTSNYTRFEEPVLDANGAVSHARVRDTLSGERYDIPCLQIAVAAGPWTDTLAAKLGHPARLRPTRGVHLVFDRARLPVDVAVAMTSVDDGRVVFAIPFGNTAYLGTTDTDYDGTADEVAATPDDVTYLLKTANHFFPGCHLAPGDVRSTWAALRPLVKSEAETAYKTSREHEIWHDPKGISTIAGGKLTTYRAMAEEFLDEILGELKKRDQRPSVSKCNTHRQPLDPTAAAALTAVGDTIALAARGQGSLALLVRIRLADHPNEAELIHPDLPWTYAQVAVATLHEQAQTVEDILVRRFQVFFRAADQGLACAPRVAALMATCLGHDDAWAEAQVTLFQAYIDRHMRCVGPLQGTALAPTAKIG